MTVYVYNDADHGDVQVFGTLAKAKKNAELNWPNEDGDLRWEKSRDNTWLWGEYVTVHKKEIL